MKTELVDEPMLGNTIIPKKALDAKDCQLQYRSLQ
jgi:hypothetical protein